VLVNGIIQKIAAGHSRQTIQLNHSPKQSYQTAIGGNWNQRWIN
jgi:hypothetical protein